MKSSSYHFPWLQISKQFVTEKLEAIQYHVFMESEPFQWFGLFLDTHALLPLNTQTTWNWEKLSSNNSFFRQLPMEHSVLTHSSSLVDFWCHLFTSGCIIIKSLKAINIIRHLVFLDRMLKEVWINCQKELMNLHQVLCTLEV